MPDFVLNKSFPADHCKSWINEGEFHANYMLWVKTRHWNSFVQISK